MYVPVHVDIMHTEPGETLRGETLRDEILRLMKLKGLLSPSRYT